jgi:hypothetical protein
MKPDLPLPVHPRLFVRYLFFFIAIVLDIFALMNFLKISDSDPNSPNYFAYALMMFLEAGAMLLSGILTHKKLVYWFGATLLSLNIVLVIFDQIGIVDLLFALVNGFTLYVLLTYREEILAAPKPPNPS